MEAKLIPLDGDKPVLVTNDVTLVGRKHGLCDLIVERASVSKLHCLIVKTDGLLFVRDLGSTNGTKVNGQRVTRGALLPGDELAFASVKYRVHLGPGQPAVGDEPISHHDRTERLSAVGASGSGLLELDEAVMDEEAGIASEAGDFVNPAMLDEDDPATSNGQSPHSDGDSRSDVRLLSDDGFD